MDEILKSLQSLRQSQEEGQTAIKRQLNQLEKDVAAGQEDTTQHVVKRLKEDQTFIFKKKENEKQFIFNDNVKDQFVATAKHLELIDEPSGSGQREAIDKAKEELKQGALDKGAWILFKELKDPELKSLADELLVTVMNCRASSTTTKYLRAFRRWKEWASSHKLPSLPAKSHHIALHLQHLANITSSKATVE